MSSKAFKEIMKGMQDALAHASGKATGGRTTYPALTDIDVARLRKALGLSQSEFSLGFGISVRTLQDWEQGRRQPEGPARVLLNVIRKDPQSVTAAIWPQKKRTSRQPR